MGARGCLPAVNRCTLRTSASRAGATAHLAVVEQHVRAVGALHALSAAAAAAAPKALLIQLRNIPGLHAAVVKPEPAPFPHPRRAGGVAAVACVQFGWWSTGVGMQSGHEGGVGGACAWGLHRGLAPGASVRSLLYTGACAWGLKLKGLRYSLSAQGSYVTVCVCNLCVQQLACATCANNLHPRPGLGQAARDVCVHAVYAYVHGCVLTCNAQHAHAAPRSPHACVCACMAQEYRHLLPLAPRSAGRAVVVHRRYNGAQGAGCCARRGAPYAAHHRVWRSVAPCGAQQRCVRSGAKWEGAWG